MTEHLLVPGRSLALSASAGSGKTWSLTTRLVGMLLNGTAPSEILAITFTNAAAGEIREKLLERLDRLIRGEEKELQVFADLLDMQPEQVAARAREIRLNLVRGFSLLHISTIHTFMLRLVRQFPLSSGLVDFRIVDDLEKQAMVGGAIEQFFGEAAADRELLRQVLEFHSSYREKKVVLSGTMSTLFDTLDGCAHLIDRMAPAPPSPGVSLERFTEARAKLLSPELRSAAAGLAGIVLQHMERTGANRNLQSVVNTMQGFAESGNISGLTDSGPLVRYTGGEMVNYLGKMLRELPGDESARFQELFNRVWQTLSAYLQAEMEYHIAVQLSLFQRIRGAYTRQKRKHLAIDFNDIELLARHLLLSGPDAAGRVLDPGVNHVLIDEFQDTSELQWDILEPLVRQVMGRGGSLFYVGDVKQSIYRWRGGQPWLFDKVRRELGLEQDRLPHSYRQNAVLLDAVNRVFGKLSEQIPGFTCEPQTLPPDSTRERGYILLHPCSEYQELYGELVRAIRALEQRNVSFSDMAVLCRTNQEVADLESLFRTSRIPFTSSGRTRLSEDWCLLDILGLLRFVTDPSEPLHLCSVLRTPLFRVPYERMRELAEGGPPRRDRLKVLEPELWTVLEKMVDASRFSTASGVLRWVYGKLPVFEAYPGREEVLLAFLEIAYRFETDREHPGVTGFLRYLEERGDRIFLKTEARAGVTVQTIHRSKGLEFHTVLLPFLNKSCTWSASGSAFLFPRDAEGAPCSAALGSRKYLDFSTDPVLHRAKSQAESDYEVDETNGLYVAMTRARENLLLFPLRGRRKDTLGSRLTAAFAACYGIEELPWSEGTPVPSGGVAGTERRLYRADRQGAGEREEPGISGTDRQAAGEEPGLSAHMPGRAAPTPSAGPRIPKAAEAGGGDGLRTGQLTGLVVHSALENLGDGMREPVDEMVQKALGREGQRYSKKEREAARVNAARILEQVLSDRRLDQFWSGRATAELGVASPGYANMVGRIDRVLVSNDLVEVVDFKTTAPDREGAHLSAYREQVASYCSVLAQVYPDKTISGYLYFTEAAHGQRLVRVV